MTVLAVLGLALLRMAAGHMQLNYPPALNASNNPYTTGTPDPFLAYPYNCCGRETIFPCRGYLPLLDRPEGASVATWAAGSEQFFSLTGIGNHYGGSCQIGFSVDKGKTFKVITSYEGNCPHRNGGVDPAKQIFDFVVPADMPAGPAVFAWAWTNREQEFFMNCAAVTISNSGYLAPYVKSPGPDKSATYLGGGPTSVDNAAPSFDMDGCTCTCVGGAKLDKDDQYTMGGCTCTCDKSPAPASSGAINKRGINFEHSGWSCECETQEKTEFGAHILENCDCIRKNEGHKLIKRYIAGLAGHFSAMLNSVNGYYRAAFGSVIAKREGLRRSTAFDDLPSMFFGDLKEGCEVPHTTVELKYPQPGPKVVEGDGAYALQLPTGDC